MMCPNRAFTHGTLSFAFSQVNPKWLRPCMVVVLRPYKVCFSFQTSPTNFSLFGRVGGCARTIPSSLSFMGANRHVGSTSRLAVLQVVEAKIASMVLISNPFGTSARFFRYWAIVCSCKFPQHATLAIGSHPLDSLVVGCSQSPFCQEELLVLCCVSNTCLEPCPRRALCRPRAD